MMKLSILIPSLVERRDSCKQLTKFLRDQNSEIEVVVNEDDAVKTVGTKRNELLAEAKGEYVAFVDDDDWVADDYVDRLLNAIRDDPDCVDLWGHVTTTPPKLFYHSNAFSLKARGDVEGVTCGMVNHLNCVRKSHVMSLPFEGGCGPYPEINFGEDERYATKLARSGLLKTEASCGDEILYFYRYNEGTSRAQWRNFIGPGYRTRREMKAPSFIISGSR